MGVITIRVQGSFQPAFPTMELRAETGGHADAVARAIEYLSQTVLPAAIRQDHKLHDEGHKPEKGFGCR